MTVNYIIKTKQVRTRNHAALHLLALVLIICTTTKVAAQSDAGNGEKIFQERCKGCHRLDTRLVGPALGPQITEETDDRYLTRWIQNNQALIAAKEPRAVSIYNAFNQSNMPVFTELSDKDVGDIINYVRTEWKKTQTAPAANNAAQKSPPSPVNDTKNEILWYVILIVGILFLVTIIILARTINVLSKGINSKGINGRTTER